MGDYEIVERLKHCEGSTENFSWFNTPEPGLITEAAATIVELAGALEYARLEMIKSGYTQKGLRPIDSALSRLKGDNT